MMFLLKIHVLAKGVIMTNDKKKTTPTHSIFVSDDDLFNGKGEQVNNMIEAWCDYYDATINDPKNDPLAGLRTPRPDYVQVIEKLVIKDNKCVIVRAIADPTQDKNKLSKVIGQKDAVGDSFMSLPSLRTVWLDGDPKVTEVARLMMERMMIKNLLSAAKDIDVTKAYPNTKPKKEVNPDLDTSLSLFDEPFDISLVTYDPEYGENGAVYYNDDVEELDEDCQLAFLNQILCENAWACGCGMPRQASAFFFKQLIDLETADYHSLPGGLELFKIACYEADIIDEHCKPTKKGNELIALFDKFNLREEEWFKTYGEQVVKVPLNASALNLKPLTNGEYAQSLVFHELTKPIPKQFDANKAMLYVGIYCSFLYLRSEEWDLPGKPDTIYNMWKTFQEKHYGETYNSLHILDNMLELEEHGGSTPGWLQHTLHAEQSLIEIEKLYGVKELFKLFLGN